jgi:hypothetical protein
MSLMIGAVGLVVAGAIAAVVVERSKTAKAIEEKVVADVKAVEVKVEDAINTVREVEKKL